MIKTNSDEMARSEKVSMAQEKLRRTEEKKEDLELQMNISADLEELMAQRKEIEKN